MSERVHHNRFIPLAALWCSNTRRYFILWLASEQKLNSLDHTWQLINHDKCQIFLHVSHLILTYVHTVPFSALASFPIQILSFFLHWSEIFTVSEILPDHTIALNNLFPSLNPYDSKNLSLKWEMFYEFEILFFFSDGKCKESKNYIYCTFSLHLHKYLTYQWRNWDSEKLHNLHEEVGLGSELGALMPLPSSRWWFWKTKRIWFYHGASGKQVAFLTPLLTA